MNKKKLTIILSSVVAVLVVALILTNFVNWSSHNS